MSADLTTYMEGLRPPRGDFWTTPARREALALADGSRPEEARRWGALFDRAAAFPTSTFSTPTVVLSLGLSAPAVRKRAGQAFGRRRAR